MARINPLFIFTLYTLPHERDSHPAPGYDLPGCRAERRSRDSHDLYFHDKAGRAYMDRPSPRRTGQNGACWAGSDDGAGTCHESGAVFSASVRADARFFTWSVHHRVARAGRQRGICPQRWWKLKKVATKVD